MAKEAERVERMSKAHNEHREVYFGQIVVDKENDLCHRDKKELDDEKLIGLSASLVREGQATPFTVCETGDFVTIGGKKLPQYRLVGGHRRYFGIDAAITNRLDTAMFHREMLVPAVVMVKGEEQSDQEYWQDILVRSVTENEQRTKHSAMERLEIVRQLEAAEVPIPRAASALGISVSQYRRDRLVAISDWLREAVVREEIGNTHAASLAEAAKDNGREKEFEEDFKSWVRRKEVVLEEQRQQQKKLGKELKGSENTIKKFLDNATVKAWLACLKEKRRFGGATSEFHFGVVVDDAKKTVAVTGVNQPIDRLQSSDVATMIAEMQAGARRLVPLLKTLRLREQAVAVSEDEIEAELARLRELARLAEEKKAQEEAGREPEEKLDVPSAESHDLGAAIDGTIADLEQDSPAEDQDTGSEDQDSSSEGQDAGRENQHAGAEEEPGDDKRDAEAEGQA